MAGCLSPFVLVLPQAVAIQRRVHEIMVTVLNTAGDINTPLSQVTRILCSQQSSPGFCTQRNHVVTSCSAISVAEHTPVPIMGYFTTMPALNLHGTSCRTLLDQECC